MRKSTALNMILGTHKRKFSESLTDIAKLTIDDMIGRGIKISDARRIHASICLAKEIAEPATKYRTLRITSPAKAMEYCKTEFTALANHAVQEEFWLVTLDGRNEQRLRRRKKSLLNSMWNLNTASDESLHPCHRARWQHWALSNLNQRNKP